MSYRVLVAPCAQRELMKLPRDAYARVKAALFDLSSDPRPGRVVRMAARRSWRIRCGAYRVVYEIDDREQTVTVLHIGHRRDVYR